MNQTKHTDCHVASLRAKMIWYGRMLY